MLGFLLGGQLDDLDFEIGEDMKVLGVGERHLGSQSIQCGLYEDNDEEHKLDFLDKNNCTVDS